MNPGYKHVLSVLIPLVMLAACSSASLRHAAPPGAGCPPPEQSLDAHELLRYHTCIGALPPADVAKEYAAVEQHFLKTGHAHDRVKLAMLLSLPDTAVHDVSTALQLLTALPDETAALPDGLRDLVRLLRASLAERQRLDDKAHRLDGKVRSLEKELAAEKLHSGALQNKIDSVKDLEKSMTQRELP